MSHIPHVNPALSNGTTIDPPETNSHSNHDEVDNNPARDDPEAATQVKQPADFNNNKVLMVSFVFLAATIGLGVAGAVKLHDGPPIKAAADIFQDPAFCILCSQVVPNVLHGLFELLKTRGKPSPLSKSPWLFYCVNSIVIILSLASPIYYGISDRTKPWSQVITIILSLATAVIINFSSLLSVFEAKRLKILYDNELKMTNELAAEKDKTLRLEKEVADLKKNASDLTKEKAFLEQQLGQADGSDEKFKAPKRSWKKWFRPSS